MVERLYNYKLREVDDIREWKELPSGKVHTSDILNELEEMCDHRGSISQFIYGTDGTMDTLIRRNGVYFDGDDYRYYVYVCGSLIGRFDRYNDAYRVFEQNKRQYGNVKSRLSEPIKVGKYVE